MEILLFRTALTPLVILLATLVARRLGPRRGGRLLGFPLTTGPFAIVVCAEWGRHAAAQAAHGSGTGQVVVAGFCLAYGRLAVRLRPAATLAAALAVAAVLGGAVVVSHSVWVSAPATLAVVTLGLRTWPAHPEAQPRPRRSRPWDTPLRMAVSGLTVAVLACGAPYLGPYTAGVLSSLPVLMAVMAPSVHRGAGPAAVTALTRGALASGAGAVAFLVVLSDTVEPAGVLAALALAVLGLLVADRLVRAMVAYRAPALA